MFLALVILMALCTLFNLCIIVWPYHPLTLRFTRPMRVAFVVVRTRGRVSFRYAWRMLTFEDFYPEE